MIIFAYSETSAPLPVFDGVVDAGNNVFNSQAPVDVPLLNNVGEFDVNKFLYWKFGFTQDGSGSPQWDNYNYGMKGEKRTGIGSFYFAPKSTDIYDDATPWIVEDQENPLKCPEKIQYWSWISTIFNLLIPDHRNMMEWIWSAMQDVGCEYSNKARRFIESLNPNNSLVNPTESYYDIKTGVLDSYPIYLDPEYNNYQITALKTQLHPGEVYSDIFVVEAVYKILRDVCVGSYAVIGDKYFKVIERKSTIESKGDPAEFVVKGDSVEYPNSSIRFVADDPEEDVSEYKVGIFWEYGPDETVDIEWINGPDKILRIVCYMQPPNGSPKLININDLINQINATNPNKWCTAYNASNPGVEYPPIWSQYLGEWTLRSREASDTAYENIVSFTYNSLDSGNYIPPEGVKWVYYDGYYVGDPKTPGVTGGYVDDESMYRHLIRVEGDLSYLRDNLTPEFYITTGKKFQIDNYVIDLPTLVPNITNDFPFFTKDIEYTYYNNFVEFFDDPKKITTDVDVLYCPKIDVIEYFLYDLYGNLCNVDWKKYNYDNEMGKVAISTLMGALQNLSSTYDFDRSSNVYGGLPVSPFDGRVIGLYESYDYKVVEINSQNLTVKLEIPEDEKLHFFFIVGAYVLVDNKFEVIIDNVDYDNAIIELNNLNNISVGSIINIKLQTNFNLNKIHDTPLENDAYDHGIQISAPLDFSKLIREYSNIFEEITNERPELLIWNQDGVDGVYHIMDSEISQDSNNNNFVEIEYYSSEQKSIAQSSRYNDIPKNINGDTAKVHFKWATHKFLLIYNTKLKYTHRVYIDAPMDTLLNPNDIVEKGDVLCRNINLLNESDFKNFTQYNKFMRTNSVNSHNKILMVSGMPVKYGSHFPGLKTDS